MIPADLLAPAPTRVMGIVNVTPDSFSDGGDYLDVDVAIQHGRVLAAEGAAIVDVGGESTRPGAARVSEAEELARVLPVVHGLVAAGIPVSVDTMRAGVAERVIDAGAAIVNDVSGGLADPRMLSVVARTDALLVLMHWRGHSQTMQEAAVYDDVVAEVCDELRQRVDAAVTAGVDSGRLILDPGIGFAKTSEHNWALLRAVDRVGALGLPVLWGHSRKRFLSEVGDGATLAPKERDTRSAQVTEHLAAHRVWGVRVHTVTQHAAAIGRAFEGAA